MNCGTNALRSHVVSSQSRPLLHCAAPQTSTTRDAMLGPRVLHPRWQVRSRKPATGYHGGLQLRPTNKSTYLWKLPKESRKPSAVQALCSSKNENGRRAGPCFASTQTVERGSSAEEPDAAVDGSGLEKVEQEAPDGEKEEEISKAMLIWRAVKLPIYSVALIPIMVGGAAAYYDVGVLEAAKFWKLLFFSVCVIAWLNLSNDGHDAQTKVDKNKKESVVNMTGSRLGTLAAAYLLLAVGAGGIWWLASAGQDPRVATLLFAAIACGYVYQCPPFRLSYKGLGEPLCFFAFGPFATTAFYLSQARASVEAALPVVSPTAMGAAILVGVTTTLILFCSHFHQIEDDRSAGKMSPLVRLGTERGARVACTAVVTLFTATTAFVIAKALPISCVIASVLLLPLGRLVCSFINDNHTDKQKIFMAKYFAVRLHVGHGVALAVALIMGRMRPLPAFW